MFFSLFRQKIIGPPRRRYLSGFWREVPRGYWPWRSHTRRTSSRSACRLSSATTLVAMLTLQMLTKRYSPRREWKDCGEVMANLSISPPSSFLSLSQKRVDIFSSVLGCLPNMTRNGIVNIGEVVTYDIIKDHLIHSNIMSNGTPCHLVSAFAAGFCGTVLASPVDVVKTRFMNSMPSQYKGVLHCTTVLWRELGFAGFYKGWELLKKNSR